MSDERLYTLVEASTELARRECQNHGHDWEFLSVWGSSLPMAIVCARCGRKASVVDQ